MRKILFLLAFLPLFLYGQKRESVYFENPIFKGEYSEVLEQPLWIEYVVLCPDGSASRKGMDFYTNDSIYTSDNKDYANNVYDKGHLAPAADFNCDREMLYSTFTYLNCALQNQYLNRGTWRLLEAHERELSATGNVSVRIEVEFARNCDVLPTGATVPTGFYKYITYNGTTVIYYFKNERPETSDYTKYVITR
jgi:endonuclease G